MRRREEMKHMAGKRKAPPKSKRAQIYQKLGGLHRRKARLNNEPDPYQKQEFFVSAQRTAGFHAMLGGGYRR